jgi:hypothetical protein
MKKTLYFEKFDKVLNIEIELKEKDGFNRLSVVGFLYGEDEELISSGQIVEIARLFAPAELCNIWEYWHLNDMRAGTKTQTGLIRFENSLRSQLGMGQMDYTLACLFLQEKDLLVDDGYRYGTAWLKEELPQEVIDYVHSL